MKQIKLTLTMFWAWVILGFIVTGCLTSPTLTTWITPSSNPAVTQTQPVSTLTPGLTKTLVAPSPTSLPTSAATPTAISAVSPEEILNLLKTNGGCQLPCWWGIMPGETTIETVKGFTERFGGLAVHVLWQETGNFAIRVPDGNVRPDIDVVYGPLGDDKVEWLNLSPSLDHKNDAGEYEIGDGRGDPRYLDYYPAYTIAALLATYGKPETVLLSGDAVNEPGPPWIYALTLVYSEKGIWAEYFGGMGGEPNFRICPMQASVSLSLWEPGKYASVEDVLSSSLPVGLWGLGLGKISTIEEKTDLTLDEFYEIFKDADYDTCIESPTDRWYKKP